jgi:hypothetical protein
MTTNQSSFAVPGNTPARGMANHGGGSYDQSSMQDIVDGDALQGPVTKLFGVAATPDVINPHVAGNYMIESGAVDPITLAAPFPGGPATLQSSGAIGGDDNLSIAIFSDTLFAHTVTATALFANGTALKTTATFAAFKGAGMILRAWNGVWQVVSSTGVTFT